MGAGDQLEYLDFVNVIGLIRGNEEMIQENKTDTLQSMASKMGLETNKKKTKDDEESSHAKEKKSIFRRNSNRRS